MASSTYMPILHCKSIHDIQISSEGKDEKEIKLNIPEEVKPRYTKERKIYDDLCLYRAECESRRKILNSQSKEKNKTIESDKLLSLEKRSQILMRFLDKHAGNVPSKFDERKLDEKKSDERKCDEKNFIDNVDNEDHSKLREVADALCSDPMLSYDLKEYKSVLHPSDEDGKKKQMRYLIHLCISRLEELGAKILWMGYDLRGFGQEDWFSRRDYDLLLFLCVKNFNSQGPQFNFQGWAFEGDFHEDYDCAPGIFRLVNVSKLQGKDKNAKNVDDNGASAYNKASEEQSIIGSIYCNMFCRNTGKDALASVMELFEETSVENLIKKKYGKYYCFADDLRSFLRAGNFENKKKNCGDGKGECDGDDKNRGDGDSKNFKESKDSKNFKENKDSKKCYDDNDSTPKIVSHKISVNPISRYGGELWPLVDLKFSGNDGNDDNDNNNSVVIYCVFQEDKILLSGCNYMDRKNGDGLYNYFANPKSIYKEHMMKDPIPIYSIKYNDHNDLPAFWESVLGMKKFIDGDYGYMENDKSNETKSLYTNADVARVLKSLPKSSNDWKFKKKWWFKPVEPHSGKMIDTIADLTFDIDQYIMRPVVVRFRIRYDTTRDAKNCTLRVKVVSRQVADGTNYYKDDRPEEFKTACPRLDFNHSFVCKGKFSFIMEEMKRIYQNLFRVCFAIRS